VVVEWVKQKGDGKVGQSWTLDWNRECGIGIDWLGVVMDHEIDGCSSSGGGNEPLEDNL
jgi:hypothetical protein